MSMSKSKNLVKGDTMSQIEENVIVIKLAEPTKDLLKLMHFVETIPEEAKYLVLFEDGNTQFFEALDVVGQSSVNINVIYYHGVTLRTEVMSKEEEVHTCYRCARRLV